MQSIQNKLQRWENNALYRRRLTLTSVDQNRVVIDGISGINFVQNDYLGLAKHPKILEAYHNGIQRYGLGSGASSVVSGYYEAQNNFERRMAEWLGAERAIIFNSGYLANLGVMVALADRQTTVYSDKLCHASILDGIQLSRAHHCRYRHRNTADLKRLGEKRKPDLIITESVFSMEGSIAPVSEIINMSRDFKSSVIIDDAHGIGVLGKAGKGICEYARLDVNELACLILPLGKAFNGVGAIVAGKEEIIEAIIQFARTYRYSTAIPPAICEALLSTLELIQSERWRADKLNELIEFFTENASLRGLRLSSNDLTPIRSILIGDNQKVTQLQERLWLNSFLISSIRPPTVPADTARIRICLNCHHSKEQIVDLLDLIADMSRD